MPVAAMSWRVRWMEAPVNSATSAGGADPPRSVHRRMKASSHRGWESMRVPSMSHSTAWTVKSWEGGALVVTPAG